MAKIRSLLWFTAMTTTSVLTLLSSCTVDDGSDDDGGGEGGELSNGGKSGGATGGTAPIGGGGASAGEDSAAGSPAGGASAGAGGASGGAGGVSGGAGGGASVKVCEASGGQGEGGATGLTCADYCAGFYEVCGEYAERAAFDSEADCRSRCELFDNDQLCCRSYHVFLAAEADGAAGAANAQCVIATGEDPCN